jgi:hypothetical protein
MYGIGLVLMALLKYSRLCNFGADLQFKTWTYDHLRRLDFNDCCRLFIAAGYPRFGSMRSLNVILRSGTRLVLLSRRRQLLLPGRSRRLLLSTLCWKRYTAELDEAVSGLNRPLFTMMIEFAFTQTVEYWFMALGFWYGCSLLSFSQITL